MKLGVMISGRGSNLAALIESRKSGKIASEIQVVVSDREEANGLEIARQNGIDAMWVNPKAFPSREAYEAEIESVFQAHQVEWVILAGYMRRVGARLLQAFPNRILNIHPSLLPAFPGLHAQRQAVDYGVKVSGCTVHIVNDLIDGGPIIAQAPVPVEEGDSEESLSARILKEEHQLYSGVICLLEEGRVRLTDGRIVTIHHSLPSCHSRGGGNPGEYHVIEATHMDKESIPGFPPPRE